MSKITNWSVLYAYAPEAWTTKQIRLEAFSRGATIEDARAINAALVTCDPHDRATRLRRIFESLIWKDRSVESPMKAAVDQAA